MKPILPLAILAAMSLAAGGALAQDPAAPAPWLSVAELAETVEQQGYTLIEVERDDGVFEVSMQDARGYRIEAHLDPRTGARLDGPRWDD